MIEISRINQQMAEKEQTNKKLKSMTAGLFDEFVR